MNKLDFRFPALREDIEIKKDELGKSILVTGDTKCIIVGKVIYKIIKC